MSVDTIELVRNGKLTSFYFKLLENVNIKLDKKIDVLSDKIVDEFEAKKTELSKLKSQLDDFNKIKLSIHNINKYYSFNKSENKQIKNVSSVQNNNPITTTKNLLDTLEDISVNIECGEYIQFRQNNTTSPSSTLLLKDSDSILSSLNRLIVKKQNVINNINPQTVSFETNRTNIIIKFNNYRVQADEINIRYLTFPTEHKLTFSYINTILGSNDGTNWDLITHVNLSYLRNFERSTLFKYPAMLKGSCQNTNYYQYFCFVSTPSKEVIPKIHINKLLNRINIPLCNFEIFGNYYSIKNDTTVNNLDSEFQEFFDTYINSNYEEVSNKVEFDYILNMLLESFKELNNVITNCKVENAMKNVLIEVSEKIKDNLEKPKPEEVIQHKHILEPINNQRVLVEKTIVKLEEVVDAEQEFQVETLEEVDAIEEVEEVDAVEETEALEEQNVDDIYLDNLMNEQEQLEDTTQKNTRKKKIKIFDTESNTIDIQNNTSAKSKYSRKKKATK
jgi:hypothetical protein